MSFDAFSLPDLLDIKRTPSHSSLEDASKIVSPALAEAMNVSLARERDFLAICINENNQVVKSYGNTTKYLLQKHFTSDIVELLPKPLAIALNTLSTDALKANK